MGLRRAGQKTVSILGRRGPRFYLPVALAAAVVVAGIVVGSYALAHGFSPRVGKWTNLHASGELPASAPNPGTYDVAARQAITYYGRDSASPMQTWAYDAGARSFKDLKPAGQPPNILASALAYDETFGRTVACGIVEGGARAETWAYDSVTNSWSNLNPAVSPPPMNFPCLAYDGAIGKVVLFEGYNGRMLQGRTWAYDSSANTWVDLKCKGAPQIRAAATMVYDGTSGRLILFGGMSFPGASPNDWAKSTWAYDSKSNTWTELKPATSPPARTGALMAYDLASGKVILFGGWSHDELLGDTWAYDSRTNTWTELNTAGSPGVRSGCVMFYDQVAGKTILCGGAGRDRVWSDAWEFSL